MNNLIYITGNEAKFSVARKVFADTCITVLQKDIDTPEIQSKSVQDVAMYSAEWGSKKLNSPVFVTDAGFYIEALNGFPGPFIKYVNQWFSAEDFINLMQDKTNRTITIQDCLAYCYPNENPVVFTGSYKGKLAASPSKKPGTPIEKLFILEGFDLPIADIPEEDMIAFWGNGEIMNKFKKYLLSK